MSAYDPVKHPLQVPLVSGVEPTVPVTHNDVAETSDLSDITPSTSVDMLFEGFRPAERVYVFIDGSNTFSAARALGFSIDFGRLQTVLSAHMLLQRIYYFTALPPDDQMSSLRRQVDWMRHHGYTVVHKTLKEYNGPDDKKIIKGNVDVELTVFALDLCEHVDHIVLFTGDGDFRMLVEALQNRGKRVTVVSTTKTRPPCASEDLRKQTDFFIELSDLQPYIKRADRATSLPSDATIDEHP